MLPLIEVRDVELKYAPDETKARFYMTPDKYVLVKPTAPPEKLTEPPLHLNTRKLEVEARPWSKKHWPEGPPTSTV